VGQDIIQITKTVTTGVHGIDDDPNTPLARAYRVLLREGKPISAAVACYFSESKVGRPCWLGVLVLSAGERVIFFPGAAEPSRTIQSADSRAVETQAFQADHISLEKNRNTWHFTQHVGRREHIDGGVTRDVDGGKLWFAMTVRRDGALRTLNRETRITAAAHTRDSQRRLRLLTTLVNKQPEHLLLLPAPAGRARTIHFTFAVTDRGAPHYHGPELLLPFGSPFLKDPLPSTVRGLAVRNHRVHLTETLDVQIVACALPAEISVPIAFVGFRRSGH
jgi:hypothetical protein